MEQPARSPDLSASDFFLCSYLKANIFTLENHRISRGRRKVALLRWELIHYSISQMIFWQMEWKRLLTQLKKIFKKCDLCNKLQIKTTLGVKTMMSHRGLPYKMLSHSYFTHYLKQGLYQYLVRLIKRIEWEICIFINAKLCI